MQLQDKDDIDLEDPWSGVLAAVRMAMRATVHTTTQAPPAQLVFNHDALHNVSFRADWNYIKDRKQRLIDQNNKRENAKRRRYTYNVGDRVRVTQDYQRKHGQNQFMGPLVIEAVNDNGTVELRQDTPNGGAVTQTWNIRNILPYKA